MFKDHEGTVWPNIQIMCDHYKIPISTFRHRYYTRKWSLELSLTVPSQGNHKNIVPSVDHEGNKFYSIVEMCAFWHIPPNVYLSRIHNYNMSVEEALTTPFETQVITDPEGKVFSNVSEMCIYYNTGLSTFFRRLKLGWSLADTLYTPVKEYKWNKIWKDHKGNVYPTFEKMCFAYDKSGSVVRYRLQHNFTLQDALEKPVHKGWKKDFAKKYPDKIKELDGMMNHYGTVDQRIKRNWDLYDAAMISGRVRKESSDGVMVYSGHEVYDHEGNLFHSIKAMCDFWEISVHIYTNRRKKGMSIKEILTTPVKKYLYTIKDHEGRIYRNIDEVCKVWNITKGMYNSRKRRGWTIKQILLTPRGQNQPIED